MSAYVRVPLSFFTYCDGKLIFKSHLTILLYYILVNVWLLFEIRKENHLQMKQWFSRFTLSWPVSTSQSNSLPEAANVTDQKHYPFCVCYTPFCVANGLHFDCNIIFSNKLYRNFFSYAILITVSALFSKGWNFLRVNSSRNEIREVTLKNFQNWCDYKKRMVALCCFFFNERFTVKVCEVQAERNGRNNECQFLYKSKC